MPPARLHTLFVCLFVFLIIITTTTMAATTTTTFASSAASSTATRLLHRGHPKEVKPSAFLRQSCSATLYPSLCLRTLSHFPRSAIRHSPRRVAYASLLVTLRHALAASSFVSALTHRHHPHPPAALLDCKDTVSDSAYQIRQCLRQMLHMGRSSSPRFQLSLSNVQTWASAALTDLTTCLDGFDEDLRAGGALKAAVGARVGVVVRVTSNSLALINRIQTDNFGQIA